MELAAELTSVDTLMHPVAEQSAESPEALPKTQQTQPTPIVQPQQCIRTSTHTTHTTQAMANTSDSGPSRGRPQHRSPPQDRSDRARSTPSRRSQDTRNVKTTSQDIRTLFEIIQTDGKRKELASSPEQQDNGKTKKADRGVS